MIDGFDLGRVNSFESLKILGIGCFDNWVQISGFRFGSILLTCLPHKKLRGFSLSKNAANSSEFGESEADSKIRNRSPTVAFEMRSAKKYRAEFAGVYEGFAQVDGDTAGVTSLQPGHA